MKWNSMLIDAKPPKIIKKQRRSQCINTTAKHSEGMEKRVPQQLFKLFKTVLVLHLFDVVHSLL